MRSSIRLILTAFLAFSPVTLLAQQPPEAEWLRYPAISPDGSSIAFSYAGQIWTIGANGGEASPLTGGPWHAIDPVWSPDGKTVAFVANRHGQYDVFVVPARGGAVTRLTFHSANDYPMSFTPDGKDVVFTSARLGDPKADATNAVYGLAGLYERPYVVSANGGRPYPLFATTALNLSYGPDGRILYEDNPAIVENTWRKHHVSDASHDIWLYDPTSHRHEQFTDFRGEDRDPNWSADGKTAYWLSESGGNFNVWRKELGGGEPQQVTFHERWPVRFLSSANDGTLAYAWNGGIWRLDPGTTEPKRISVTIGQGNLIDTTSLRDVTKEVSQMAISPGGKEIAFVARGEIFVTGWKSKVTRRITNTVAQERDPSFSADGRGLVYASERSGDWDIYETALANDHDTELSAPVALDEHVLIDEPVDLFGPVYDPAGERIAYISNRSELRVQDLASGTSIAVQAGDQTYSYNDGDLSLEWSPDGQWLTSRIGFSMADVALIASDGSKVHNLSQSGFGDQSPHFSSDGSAVVWGSDRYGLRTTEGKSQEMDVMAAFLTRDSWERFNATTVERSRASDESEKDNAQPSDKEASKGEIIPEPDGIRRRTARLTPRSGNYLVYRLLSDNSSLASVSATASGTVEARVRGLSSAEDRKIFEVPAANVLAAEFDPEGTAIFVLTPGTITRYDLASGKSDAVSYHAEIDRSVREEVDYIVRSNWRATEQSFYRADMQGTDWQGVRDHYLPFAPHIFHWEDLAELQGEMDGELNASHQNPSYHGTDPLADATGVLGLYYDPDHKGDGIKILEVMPGGPSDRLNSPLKPGATILAVDGAPIKAGMGIERLLNRTAGKEVRLSVKPADGVDTVEAIVTPITTAQEFALAYQRWVDKRRAMVAELSGGRMGYIHLRAMKTEPYQTAFGDLFGLHRDADAVLVDIRANGGGNLHDELIVMLTGTSDAKTVARDGHVVTRYPHGRWTKPSILLQNAGSYSDGSVFPMLYKKKGVGKIVGDRTPGTGTAVSEVQQLQSGLRYRVPELGFQLNDGTWFENTEIEPDILVHNDPNLVAEGKDPQLEAAVKAMLEQLN